MTKPLPNWDIWLHMPKMTTHQAVCLSFGLDPSRITAYDQTGKSWGWSAKRLFHTVPGFNDRRTLLSACHRGGLSVLELSKWAQSVGWNIPVELAKLAPVPVDAPEALHADAMRAALVGVAATGADIDELQKEIVRLGITFTIRDGVETVEIPDGNIRSRREPLSGLYVELVTLYNNMPKGSKLGTLLRSSGASGGGAHGASYRQPHTPQKPVQTTAVPEPTTPSPAPVVADSASTAPGKVWTPEKLAEVKAYREKHGTKKAAAHYQVSESRIRKLLPGDKPKPKGYSAFTHRMK